MFPKEPRITVAIPVGPNEGHCKYLPETLDSLCAQTEQNFMVLLVDDMHQLMEYGGEVEGMRWRCENMVEWTWSHRDWWTGRVGLYFTAWRVGVPHAFNFGVAMAPTELVLMLGADDTAEPTCIEECLRAWNNFGIDAYYYLGVRYMDTGEEQTVPCNEAMVTKGFWKETGGFPPESAVGACDAAFISTLMVHKPERLIPVASGMPLVNYRRHAETDTASRSVAWQGPILATRNLLTLEWKQPQWGRYA